MNSTIPDLIRIPTPHTVFDFADIPVNERAIEFSSQVQFDFLGEVGRSEVTDLNSGDDSDLQNPDLL